MINLTREEAQKILDALEYAYDNEMFVGMRVILRAKLSEPEIAQFKFQEYGPDNWGDSQVTKPEFVAEQKATNEALRSMVQSEPTIDGWPLYSGLPPVKIQDDHEANYKSFAQSAQVIGGQYDPRREWVGLTDEEMFDIYGQNHVGKLCNLGRLVEAKLKEKNGF